MLIPGKHTRVPCCGSKDTMKRTKLDRLAVDGMFRREPLK